MAYFCPARPAAHVYRLEEADHARVVIIELPPKLTKGSGMPVTGAIPIVMPMLMKTWTGR